MLRKELENSCEEAVYALNNILRLDSPNQISSRKKVGASRVKLFISDVHCRSNKVNVGFLLFKAGKKKLV